MKPTPYDFGSVLASFFEVSHVAPEQLAPYKSLAEDTARRALDHPDVNYMPAFKVLDFLGHIVSHTAGIAAEPHLRPSEGKAMLAQLLRDDAPLLTRFAREAALERVRYEPVMLKCTHESALAHRNAILTVRLERMLSIYDNAHVLSPAQLTIIREHAHRAIAAPEFATYRAGPMCQFFAEMLQQAERVTSNEAITAQIEKQIGEQSVIWKRFRLKSHRFSADANDPLITGAKAERIRSVTLTPPHLH